jgi:AraC-like DNA-binding protein/mannose-6-phosphate isomerase-like protein (cupin superfamily)
MSKKRHVPDAVKDLEDQVVIRSMAVSYSSGYALPAHTHDWHQLIFASEGVMNIHTGVGSWVVPPQRAVWVPAGIEHSVEMSGTVSMRTLYFRRGPRSLSAECSVVNVPPLLRELILHAVRIGMLSRTVASHRRLAGVILDQLTAVPTLPLQLPMPRDPRARRVTEMLLRSPDHSGSLNDLTKEAGASKRTLERLFHAETKMTFGRWRQQLRLLHALRLLAAGASVTEAASSSGYDSTSAFISMFKKALGTTPRRYYA